MIHEGKFTNEGNESSNLPGFNAGKSLHMFAASSDEGYGGIMVRPGINDSPINPVYANYQTGSDWISPSRLMNRTDMKFQTDGGTAHYIMIVPPSPWGFGCIYNYDTYDHLFLEYYHDMYMLIDWTGTQNSGIDIFTMQRGTARFSVYVSNGISPNSLMNSYKCYDRIKYHHTNNPHYGLITDISANTTAKLVAFEFADMSDPSAPTVYLNYQSVETVQKQKGVAIHIDRDSNGAQVFKKGQTYGNNDVGVYPYVDDQTSLDLGSQTVPHSLMKEFFTGSNPTFSQISINQDSLMHIHRLKGICFIKQGQN